MSFLKTADDMIAAGFVLVTKKFDLTSQATRFANEAEDEIRNAGKPASSLLPSIHAGDAIRGTKHEVQAWVRA